RRPPRPAGARPGVPGRERRRREPAPGTAMAPRPLVLIHGYSASGDSFGRWRELLAAAGRPTETLHVCTYRTLTNEVTLDDIADALDRALAVQAGLDGDEEFDALV